MIIDRINLSIKNILDQTRVRLFKSSNSYVLENPRILYQFREQHLGKLIEKLDVLNPMNTLKRGYAIIKKDEKVISDSQKVKKDDIINVALRNGKINAKVLEVSNE